jgi:hypothetical protein
LQKRRVQDGVSPLSISSRAYAPIVAILDGSSQFPDVI